VRKRQHPLPDGDSRKTRSTRWAAVSAILRPQQELQKPRFLQEVTFNKTNVTSLDWNSYPILRFEECPEVVPVVVQRVNEKSTGAGEEVMAAAAAAFANAFFDATGVRLRGYPFTRKRVLAALTSRRAGI